MTLEFRPAGSADEAILLAFMREFYASQHYPFDAPHARRALAQLLADPSLGLAWIVQLDGSPIGYIVLCFGFSLEYGGRDAFIDELLITASARGRGFGRQTLAFVLGQAKAIGVRAVHLEVEHANPAAHELYLDAGFQGKDRHLMTWRAPD